MSASVPRDDRTTTSTQQLVQAELVPRLLDAEDDAVVRQLARELEQEVPEQTERLVGWLAEVFPHLDKPDGDTKALAASISDNMHTMWRMVAGRLRPDQVEPPPSALLWPRKMVHDNVPVSVLQRVYYVGHAMIWHRWVQPKLAALSANDTGAVSARLHAETFNYLDRAALRVAEHYEAEQAESFASGVRSRATIVYDILSGTTPTRAMLNRLGFALQDRHCGWVLWASSCQLDRQKELLQVAERVHAILGGAGRLSIMHGPSEVWAWTSNPVSMTSQVRERLRQLLAPRAADDGKDSVVTSGTRAGSQPRSTQDLHLVISAPDREADGFRDGNADARRIQALVDRTGLEAPTVHTSQETGLAALLLNDPVAARRFVKAQLGALAADEANARARRQTTLEFLTNGGSYSRAATALGVHRNTVLYRLQRASKDLGRDIELPEHELAAALLVAAWLPREDG